MLLRPDIPSHYISQAKIIVVDDATLNRELIISYLNSAGFNQIESAVNGIDALQKIENFVPDLIIVDLLMPKMNGFELIKVLRQQHLYSQTPIIVQTGIHEPEQRIEAWQSGANDILTKPIHRLELLSRVEVQLRNLFLIRQLEDYHKLAEEDIQQALEFQLSLLPQESEIIQISKKYELSINSLFMPSRFLSGDLWGLIPIDDNRLAVWICDFSGKGIRAALNTFRIHTLIHEHAYCADNPSEMLDALSKRLARLIPIGYFATFLFGVININANTFSYASASSTHPIIYSRNKREYKLGDGSGVPLGVVGNQNYHLKTFSLEKNDSLILYSDLLWEEKPIPGVSFLEEDLPPFVEELAGRPFVTTIAEQLSLLGDLTLSDDLTLIEFNRM